MAPPKLSESTLFRPTSNCKEQTDLIIDIAVPRDENIQEFGKIDKFQSLKTTLEQLPKVKIIMIPVVVGALGAIADRVHGWLSQIPWNNQQS